MHHPEPDHPYQQSWPEGVTFIGYTPEAHDSETPRTSYRDLGELLDDYYAPQAELRPAKHATFKDKLGRTYATSYIEKRRRRTHFGQLLRPDFDILICLILLIVISVEALWLIGIWGGLL